MHEIVTLQFGQQANYIGTHYWNIQESYFTYGTEEESPVDHDVSFRPGIGADGAETYTPRTLIYDLKGAFGTLRRENALYELQQQENPAQQNQWSGSTIPLELPRIAPSSYQQALDEGTTPPVLTTDTVRFWSDYNHVYYHPRSIVQMNEYELGSDLMPFEQWQKGEELFMNLDREYDLLDRDVRPFLEECDQLQGIQIFSGIDDAWGGFTAKYLERLADELGKGSRWVFGLQETQRVARDRQALQIANVAQSLHAIDSSASMHIPLGSVPSKLPEYLAMDGSSRWFTSALQAAGIESLTLPARLRSSQSARATFDDQETTLNGDGKRRIAASSISVKDPAQLAAPTTNGQNDARMTNGQHHDEDFEEKEVKLDLELFPTLSLNVSSARRGNVRRGNTFSRLETLRGTWRAANDVQNSNEQARNRFASSNGPRTSAHQTGLLFPLLSSYPTLFNFADRPQKLAVQASLSTSTAIADQIRSVEGVARRMVSIDEREALCDGLAAMADEYEEGYSSDDDSDED
ncbi:related to Protein DML1 [Ramularia collo-cygni]|uniref:Related to Protein DML1 n=1 Tax=Ramularia collo-cygni TaxID=112498 RepID=A0A2D3V520_9PEZI|nr:related to Protein DML1 [Ramularia collo-cygni]CZT19797.1 related to Protein DML1 [Ramularia collo-cygni]